MRCEIDFRLYVRSRDHYSDDRASKKEQEFVTVKSTVIVQRLLIIKVKHYQLWADAPMVSFA